MQSSDGRLAQLTNQNCCREYLNRVRCPQFEMEKYFVVIPVFNEEKHIKKCIDHVKKYWKHIIVVNDGSTDATKKILNSISSIHVLHLPKNQGKGQAMLEGAKYAWKQKAKGVVFMDGDNQHNPIHIQAFVKELRKTGSHIIIGIRLLRTNIPFHRKIGNLFIAGVMKHLFSLTIPDIMCGFRAMTKKGFSQIKWESKGYGVETEMLTIIGRKKIPYKQVVVDTIYHDRYKGFSVIDGVFILTKLLYWKLRKL